MKKPKVVTTTYLRDNLADLKKWVLSDVDNIAWIANNKTGVELALIDADKLVEMQQKLQDIEDELFMLQMKDSIEESEEDYKAGRVKTANSVEDFLKQLDEPWED